MLTTVCQRILAAELDLGRRLHTGCHHASISRGCCARVRRRAPLASTPSRGPSNSSFPSARSCRNKQPQRRTRSQKIRHEHYPDGIDSTHHSPFTVFRHLFILTERTNLESTLLITGVRRPRFRTRGKIPLDVITCSMQDPPELESHTKSDIH